MPTTEEKLFRLAEEFALAVNHEPVTRGKNQVKIVKSYLDHQKFSEAIDLSNQITNWMSVEALIFTVGAMQASADSSLSSTILMDLIEEIETDLHQIDGWQKSYLSSLILREIDFDSPETVEPDNLIEEVDREDDVFALKITNLRESISTGISNEKVRDLRSLEVQHGNLPNRMWAIFETYQLLIDSASTEEEFSVSELAQKYKAEFLDRQTVQMKDRLQILLADYFLNQGKIAESQKIVTNVIGKINIDQIPDNFLGADQLNGIAQTLIKNDLKEEARPLLARASKIMESAEWGTPQHKLVLLADLAMGWYQLEEPELVNQELNACITHMKETKGSLLAASTMGTELCLKIIQSGLPITSDQMNSLVSLAQELRETGHKKDLVLQREP